MILLVRNHDVDVLGGSRHRQIADITVQAHEAPVLDTGITQTVHHFAWLDVHRLTPPCRSVICRQPSADSHPIRVSARRCGVSNIQPSQIVPGQRRVAGGNVFVTGCVGWEGHGNRQVGRGQVGRGQVGRGQGAGGRKHKLSSIIRLTASRRRRQLTRKQTPSASR